MSVRKLPDNKVTKDGRAYAFYINEYGLDGKRHQHQSKAYMTYEEAIQAEKDYINKYKDKLNDIKIVLNRSALKDEEINYFEKETGSVPMIITVISEI